MVLPSVDASAVAESRATQTPKNFFQLMEEGVSFKDALSQTTAHSRAPKKKTSDQLALEAAKKEEGRYQDLYRPLNQELMGSIGNNEIVNQTRQSLNDTLGKTTGRRSRQLARYGVTDSPIEAKEAKRSSKLDDALTQSFTMDQARTNQYLRDDTLRRQLTNIGRGMATSGQEGLDQAAAFETNRRNQQHMMDAQQSAAKTGLMGQAAGAALMYALFAL